MVTDNAFNQTWKKKCPNCEKRILFFRECKCMERNNKYVDRLSKEWLTHGKIIIGVDYDSTICPWPTIDNMEDIKKTIDLLQLAYATGAYIVINTCSHIERYSEIQEHCDKMRIPISAINTNPFDLPYGKTGKIYANIYLDDRAGLKESLQTLEQAMYIVRGNQAKNLTLGEQAK